jgi:O-antigen/teichoic acid export membrane protein
MSRSVKNNFVYNMALTIGQLLIPLLSFPYLTRILKPEGIGLISFVESIVMYLVLVASLGIPIYGVREIAKCVNKEERSKVFCEIFSIHAIAIIAGLIIYGIVVFSFTKTYAHLPFFALGVISYIASNLSFEWFFQGSENYKFITIRTLLVRIAILIAIFLLIKNPGDILLYYGVLTSGLFVNSIISILYLRKHLTVIRPSSVAIKRHLRPIFSLFATRFFISVYAVLLNALIGFLSTDKAVGYFAAAYKVYIVSGTLILAYNTVIIPKMTQSYTQGNESAMHRFAANAYDFIIDFAIPFAAFIFVNAYPIINIIAGHEYDRSVTDLQILAPLIFIIGFSNVFAMNILTPMGNDKYFLYAVIAGMSFSLLVTIPFIVYYSDLGASVGLLLTELLICSILAYHVKKTWQLTLNFKRLLLCIILLIPFYLINVIVGQYVSNFIINVGYNGVLCLLYWLFLQVFIFKNRQYIDWAKPYMFKFLNIKSDKPL